jgi:hypothetical protein
MTERELLKELARLQQLPASTDDWRDLSETIDAYQRRCLARAIVASPRREEIVATIKQLAGAA